MDPATDKVKQDEFWGKPISIYTRAQAIADGILVDVTEIAREAGIRFPTCVTVGVWTEVVRPPENAKLAGESEAGRLWDVLWMAVCAIRRLKARASANGRNEPEDTITFSMIATDKADRKQVHKLWAKIDGGDDGAPVITIMLIGED